MADPLANVAAGCFIVGFIVWAVCATIMNCWKKPPKEDHDGNEA